MINAPKIKMILERSTEASDGGGGFTKTWTQLRVIKGTLTFGRGEERQKSGSEKVTSTHQFWAQKLSADFIITEKDRLKYIFKGGFHIYDIVYVDPILEAGRWLKIDLLRIDNG